MCFPMSGRGRGLCEHQNRLQSGFPGPCPSELCSQTCLRGLRGSTLRRNCHAKQKVDGSGQINIEHLLPAPSVWGFWPTGRIDCVFFSFPLSIIGFSLLLRIAGVHSLSRQLLLPSGTGPTWAVGTHPGIKQGKNICPPRTYLLLR